MRRTIYEDSICRVVLRDDNQCWLGRFIVVPRGHQSPPEFWANSVIRNHCIEVYNKCVTAVTKAFGAVCVQMAQLGALTVDENNLPTADQLYQHCHLHGIPRYVSPPTFCNKTWPDPQYKENKFSALNIDPKAGLPILKPSINEVQNIVKAIQMAFPTAAASSAKL